MNLPQVITLAANAVTITALLVLLFRGDRRPRAERRARRKARRQWEQLPRLVCPTCLSTHWYTVRSQDEPFRMEERRCDDCGARFYEHEEQLAREERDQQKGND